MSRSAGYSGQSYQSLFVKRVTLLLLLEKLIFTIVFNVHCYLLLILASQPWFYTNNNIFMALNGLLCVDVPLRNCSLTHSLLLVECSQVVIGRDVDKET